VSAVAFIPPALPAGALEELCRELGDTVSGSQLTRLMRQAGIRDVSGESTKWKRLYYSIAAHQERSGNGKAVVAALHAIMDPSRFTGSRESFEAQRNAVNLNLAFAGLQLGSDGRVARLPERARTLDEAQERADVLGAELRRRGVHPDVLSFCRTELLQENYFHAVLEAAKSVADKIRERTGLQGDGADLVDRAFTLRDNTPALAFNRLETDWERSEHKGLALLIKGLFGTFRNPTAHAPRVKWATERDEALDMLTLASMRRLDAAEVTPSAPAYRHQ
jgi:uncharacterized protein (TIGR02391 family)